MLAMVTFPKFQLLYLGLLFLTVVWIRNTAAQISSAAFTLIAKGHRLKDSLISERKTYSVTDCAHFCLSEYPACRSINYEIKENIHSNSLHKCQLNNDTKSPTLENIVEDKAFNYLEPLQKLLQKEPEPVSPVEIGLQEPFSATFTNLGASGRIGPTSLGSFYAGQDHENMVTVVNGIQHWTVPFTGTYQITAVGASGGYDNSGLTAKGRGAYIKGDFDLKAGDVLKIMVGQEGAVNSAHTSSGGGGGTFVVASSNTPLIVAGGGGGIESLAARLGNCDANSGTSGRQNQCSSSCASWSGGTNGNGGQEADVGNSGGGGGGYKSDGRSSKQFGGNYGNGGEGGKSFLQGGAGGRAWRNNAVGGFGGGGGAYGGGGGAGGGGGYSGGASGDNVTGSCGGGGGSYNSGTNQQNTVGFRDNGHGYVEINRIFTK